MLVLIDFLQHLGQDLNEFLCMLTAEQIVNLDELQVVLLSQIQLNCFEVRKDRNNNFLH